MTDKSKSFRKSASQEERQETLRSRKELIRTRQAKGIVSSRRRGRLVRQLSCMGDKDPEQYVEIDLAHYLPPQYTMSKKVKHLIEVRTCIDIFMMLRVLTQLVVH